MSEHAVPIVQIDPPWYSDQRNEKKQRRASNNRGAESNGTQQLCEVHAKTLGDAMSGSLVINTSKFKERSSMNEAARQNRTRPEPVYGAYTLSAWRVPHETLTTWAKASKCVQRVTGGQ